MVLTNFRPEFSAGWMRHSYYRQVPLGPLREDAVEELLVAWLGEDQSLAPLVGLVLQRTGGNPFFVEEIVRALVSDGTLEGTPGAYRLGRSVSDIRVPPTVQATLEARIDRLPAGQKALLQTAAVVGRTFSEAALGAVTGMDAKALGQTLRALATAELLQHSGEPSAREFRFWHPVTQEVAYNTLLSRRRADLHAAVAAFLADESLNAGERAALIAWHWQRAGQPVEAARWLLEAGTWALRTDLGEAERQWRAAIQLLDGSDETTQSQRLGVGARIRMFQFGARTGVEQQELDRLYAEARSLAERLGDTKLLAWTVAFSGSMKFWSGQLRKGLSRYVEGLALAERAGDPEMQATVGFAPAVALLYLGPLSDGLANLERALEFCAGDPDRGAGYLGYSPLTRTLEFRARALLLSGRLPEAARDLELCLALARPRAEPDPLCWALSLVARFAWLSGEGNSSAAAAEAVKIAEETGNAAGLVLALQGTALSEMMAGRPPAAVSACHRALAAARERRSGLFEEASVLAHLAVAQVAAGDPAAAVRAADEAVAVARDQEATVVECLALLSRAQARWATGDGANAEVDLAGAIVAVKESGALTYEPFIHEQLGRLRNDEEELRQALGLYRQIGATGHARRLEGELLLRRGKARHVGPPCPST
jgi:adenylate cyclase